MVNSGSCCFSPAGGSSATQGDPGTSGISFGRRSNRCAAQDNCAGVKVANSWILECSHANLSCCAGIPGIIRVRPIRNLALSRLCAVPKHGRYVDEPVGERKRRFPFSLLFSKK